VAHTCNPSYLKRWDWEDWVLRSAWTNSLRNPQLQNNHSKRLFWRCDSSIQALVFQVWSPEFVWRQKFHKTPSQPMAGHSASRSSQLFRESTNRRISVQASTGIKWDSNSTMINTWVECLKTMWLTRQGSGLKLQY
jgi:hypothetical protein